MSSGVKVSDISKTTFGLMKSKRQYRYIFFQILNGKLEVALEGDRDKTYKDFLEDLNALGKQCRFILYDYPAPCKAATEVADHSIMNDKLIVALWCPETATVKDKMHYASSFQEVKKNFPVNKYVQATCVEEIDETAMLERIKPKDR